MESIVISLGGSVVLSEDVDISFFNDLKNLFKKISKNNKLYLVIGGGKTARTYIKLGRKFKLTQN
jgi:uridylate kinase